MRSHEILTTSATLLSSQALLVFGNEVKNAIPYYQPKAIKPEVAAGGLQKLIDRGVLRLESTPQNTREEMHKRATLKNNQNQGNKRRSLQKHAKADDAVETRTTGHHGGTRAGAKQRSHHEGDVSEPE
jgi:hypothetical protein